jgi:hypothetical protein
MVESEGKTPRSKRASDIMEIASLPLALGAAIFIGYFLGHWIGTRFFPDHANAWRTGGVLYGLAAGIYHAVKTLRMAIRRADADQSRRAKPGRMSYRPPGDDDESDPRA